ncbi:MULTISPECIES: hypothetical protein [Vibrio harveyi group]|uniref:hypothetical protein n=1 Tax=Vibrio harveyi group TaxID=717610 RepID=UPI0009717C3F|nr:MULTISPECIES: hypothetical protein [Vibrio harveyi group]APX05883.1 hypothetical protein BWP24_06740 [Vibrio campbellii]ARR06083.1 unknow [Vibrio campbellii]MBE4150856.1 hypothetical protein [Vibrio parahaemolyticus]TOB57812.1 hypothetical protein CGK02_23655 [Vibrio parahaemolyticus]TOI48149.1 hypothetical protein CGI58_24375 [Vibrio parahaemolyticus]
MANNVYRVMAGDDVVVAGEDQVVVTLEDALSAVDELGDLVHSVKKEVKDFISENWDEFLEKLTGIDVPEYLLEQYPDFYQYLEWVLQLVGLM